MSQLYDRAMLRALRRIDGLSAQLAEDITAIIELHAGDATVMTEPARQAMMREIDRRLALDFGPSRRRAMTSRLYVQMIREMDTAQEVTLVDVVGDIDAKMTARYGRRWTTLKREIDEHGEALPDVIMSLGGPHSAAERRIRARLFDPQRRWVDPTGYRLSDRIWRIGVNHRREIDRAVKDAIQSGTGVRTAAQDVMHLLHPNYNPVRVTGEGIVYRSGGEVINSRVYATRRLMRTEFQRVNHDVTVNMVRDLSRDVPGMAVRYALSPNHPEPDVCDDYADGHSQGFPRGVYLPNEVPRIPHPNCMCSRSPWVPPREDILRLVEERYAP